MSYIDKLAWIHIQDGKLLVARSKGKETFYIPGGKRDPGETDEQALIREINEELSLDLIPQSIEFYGVFQAQADGKAAGQKVQITCYQGSYEHGSPTASAEIEEFIWISSVNEVPLSKVTVLVAEDLIAKGLLKLKSTIENVTA